jgi:SAM-dependent methyltransferase
MHLFSTADKREVRKLYFNLKRSKMDWKEFWNNYRNIEGELTPNRYLQVGKTVNRQPIAHEEFNAMVNDIAQNLNLQKEDELMELCCGNGLLTEPLSQCVKKIYAFDFTERLVKVAQECNVYENIEYAVGDAKGDLRSIFNRDITQSKFLMNDSLGYFTIQELIGIINQVRKDSFLFYLTGVPSDALKWNFYNTEERRKSYLKEEINGNCIFDGIGKWWKSDELLEVASLLKLNVSIIRQPIEMSSFRMNVLFSSK